MGISGITGQKNASFVSEIKIQYGDIVTFSRSNDKKKNLNFHKRYCSQVIFREHIFRIFVCDSEKNVLY